MFRRLKEFLVGVMIVGGLMVGGKVSALTYSSDVGVRFTFNSSLQVNVSADLVISNLSPGTDSDSNIIDVVVKTNNVTGYTLNATVGNNTTYNTRNLVHEVSGSSANFASINYGSSMASLSADNTWGYSYSTNNGSTWSNYDGLPLYSDATNIATLKTATGPASTNAGDKVNFKIAAKAATSQYSGEYNNVINFVATANPVPTLGPVACTSGKICYNDNSLEEAIGTMGQQTASSSSSAVLYASNFSRQGYGFAGWNTAFDYSGTFYGPNETITTPSDMSEGLPLYAVWVNSAGSMQSNAASVCSSLTTASANGATSLSSVSALTDQRDSQTYAIAKLADGNCWMIENLRLESTNSDNSTGALAQGYEATSTLGSFVGLAAAESFTMSTSSANSIYYYGTQSGTANMNINTSNNPIYRMPRYNNDNTQSRQSGASFDTADAIYSYGNYYTWPAAIASTNNYATSYEIVENTSICPLGWRLPYGGAVSGSMGSGGFYYLSLQLGNSSVNWRKFPNNFIYSGVYYGPNPDYRSEDGFYWSSTITQQSSYPYSLNLSTNWAYSDSNVTAKNNGASIRCIIGS